MPASGRKGCRAMKGLPPDGNQSSYGHRAAAAGQTRAASVRPLYPTGPSTGAMYMVYSAAKRVGARVDHTLHHTWAIWDLAPANTSQTAPAPMLASFDWFMPDHNV